jgi:HK97 gp10 family phage protein
MSVELQGFDTIIAKLDKVADIQSVKAAITEASLFVEDVAREKAPKGAGDLRGSIESKVEVKGSEVHGTVFTPLFYAPYVEYGTGLFAEKGNGRKDVPWVYCDDAGNFHSTIGMHPQPFLRPALYENRETIKEYMKEALIND